MIRRLLEWLSNSEPATAEDVCPLCQGEGYDASGQPCSCTDDTEDLRG